MAAGRITQWRTALFQHPSFWNESDADKLPEQVLEDPKVIQNEQYINSQVTHAVTPFVASLDEVTVNVGPLAPRFPPTRGGMPRHPASADVFKRLLLPSPSRILPNESYGWKERHQAYQCCAKLIIGPARLIAPSGCDPDDATRRLSHRLSNARLEIAPSLRPEMQQSGGNSLFEAVSRALWGTPSFASKLRQLAVDYMKDCPGEYAPFLGKDFEPYLEWMARADAAGDELVLRVLADRFGIAITVLSGDEASVWCVRYPPRNTLSKREIVLAIAPPATFRVVRRLSTLSSIKQSLGRSSESQSCKHHGLRPRLEIEASLA